MSPEVAGWRRAERPDEPERLQPIRGASTAKGAAQRGCSPTGLRSRRRQDLRPMTLRHFFARLAFNATPRSSFSAGLYSALHSLRDHSDFQNIPLTLPL